MHVIRVLLECILKTLSAGQKDGWAEGGFDVFSPARVSPLHHGLGGAVLVTHLCAACFIQTHVRK